MCGMWNRMEGKRLEHFDSFGRIWDRAVDLGRLDDAIGLREQLSFVQRKY